MPRPNRQQTRTSVYLPESGLAACDEIAAEMRVTRSDAIRALLSAALVNPSAQQRARNELRKTQPRVSP